MVVLELYVRYFANGGGKPLMIGHTCVCVKGGTETLPILGKRISYVYKTDIKLTNGYQKSI